MDPALVTGLANWGPAGAVILVVILFLRSNEKRDVEWRNFFTELNKANGELNKANREDLCVVADKLENVVRSLDAHDAQAKKLLSLVEEIRRMLTPRAKKAAD